MICTCDCIYKIIIVHFWNERQFFFDSRLNFEIPNGTFCFIHSAINAHRLLDCNKINYYWGFHDAKMIRHKFRSDCRRIFSNSTTIRLPITFPNIQEYFWKQINFWWGFRRRRSFSNTLPTIIEYYWEKNINTHTQLRSTSASVCMRFHFFHTVTRWWKSDVLHSKHSHLITYWLTEALATVLEQYIR